VRRLREGRSGRGQRFGKVRGSISARPPPVANALPSNATEQPVDDEEVAFKGQWNFVPAVNLGSTNASFHVSNNQGDQAVLQFKGLRDTMSCRAVSHRINCTGSGIAVQGFRNITSGVYSATLDGATTSFNGASSFLQPSVLFFQTGLDPTQEHTLMLTNGANALLAIGTIDLITIPTAPSCVARLPPQRLVR
jgi:hypothetical protein